MRLAGAPVGSVVASAQRRAWVSCGYCRSFDTHRSCAAPRRAVLLRV